MFEQTGDFERAAIEHARFFLDRLRVEAEGYRSFDQAKCQTLFAEFRQNDTWQVPTLTINRMWDRLDDSKMTSDPRLVYVGRKSRSRRDDRTQPQIRRWNNADYQMARGIFGLDERIVGSMYRGRLLSMLSGLGSAETIETMEVVKWRNRAGIGSFGLFSTTLCTLFVRRHSVQGACRSSGTRRNPLGIRWSSVVETAAADFQPSGLAGFVIRIGRAVNPD